MSKLLSFILISSCFLVGTSTAQTIGPEEILERGEYDDLIGYVPKSMESLVGTSTIIIKGRFRNFLHNELFFGYENTRESLKEDGWSDEDLDYLAITISDYEVLIDEVLLGDFPEDTIVYRVLELPPTDRRFTNPSVERIFFLGENPDGTYSPRGPASVQNARQGIYSYDSLVSHSRARSEQALKFVESTNIEAFEKKLQEVIAVEKSKRN